MSDQDQLEREVEASLARLATRAVPDTARPPAPPWDQRRTVVDVRRFGRATPWLIAAVLLVIAGLGVGASVAFDASAPDRAPVGTDLPTPTGTATVPDGTLGTPAPTTTPPTSRSTPTLSRDSNGSGPDDGVGPFVAGLGSYGPVEVGMTRDQALAALGLDAADPIDGYGSTCRQSVPMPGTGLPGRPPVAIVDDSAGGTVIGFQTAADATDAFGNGPGSTLAELQASYPSGQIVKAQDWTFTVLDGSGRGLGFALNPANFNAGPDATTPVTFLLPGTADYASGYELCVG